MRIYTIHLFAFVCAMCINVAAWAQNSVTGKVIDENNSPLAGATVIIQNTYTGVNSRADGTFSISNLTSDSVTLETSFLGYTKNVTTVKVGATTPITITMQPEAIKMKRDVIITATTVTEKTPVAFQNLDSQYVADNNIGVNIPILLDQATSVVTTSDAGNGIGYAGMRIRGSDATRVNVTINGVPFNDPESQGTFFVNMPDLLSSADDVQIQRGVGTSTNGSGAFGASVNINTTQLEQEAYGRYTIGTGSFNTLRNTLSFGSGLTKNNFAFDGRLSTIQSDGYVDRATADLKAYYAKAGYYGKKFSAKFITFGGNERTYQAWNGAPNDNSVSRTFNAYDYKNQVDDYSQTFYQLHLNYEVSDNLKLSLSGFHIIGKGFYEQYKGDQYNLATGNGKEDLSDYGMAPVIIGGDTIYETNLVRRKWLDNAFTGGIFNLIYSQDRFEINFGGGMSKYVGDHFGKVIWSEYASNTQIGHEYYRNQGIKDDWNVYGKLTYDATDKLSLFGDLQFRGVNYTVEGVDDDARKLDVNTNAIFINPKAGASYVFDNKSSAYFSFARANHEPNRSDFVDAAPGVTPAPEELNDFEAGYRYKNNKFKAYANAYYMQYTNQLVLTGAVNDVGGAIRQNVENSYRTGIEVELGYLITNGLSWNINGTFSQNRIQDFTHYVDDWYNGGQIANRLGDVEIAFSPSVIAGSNLTYTYGFKKRKQAKSEASVSLITKYVGEQYMDNSNNNARKLDAYLVNDLRLTYKLSQFKMNSLSVNFTIRNLFSSLYTSNAWVYTYNYEGNDWDPSADDLYSQKVDNDGNHQMMGLFHQAERNYMLTLTFDF